MGQLTTMNLDQKFEQTHLVICDVAIFPVYQYTCQLTTMNLDQKFEQTHLVICDVAIFPVYQYTCSTGTIVNNMHI